MLKKLVEYLGREVEIWTTENTEPWMGILKEANADYIMLMIDELQTFLVTNKIVAFRLSEGEQGGPRDVVVLNAAAALIVAGKAQNLRQGAQLADEALRSGGAHAVFNKLLVASNR